MPLLVSMVTLYPTELVAVTSRPLPGAQGDIPGDHSRLSRSRLRSNQLQQQRPLGVEPVLRLIHHDCVGAIENLVIDLDITPNRQAMHDDPFPASGRAKSGRG